MFCPHCHIEVPPGFKFCGNCGQKLLEAAIPTSELQATSERPITPSSSASASLSDERRDVTVLFADVKGFTSMCERLDPEEVHSVMNDCFDGLARAITEEGGHVDKYIGDNVMALFGAPVAHEDDPTRACLAALAMQEFLDEFSQCYQPRTGVRLQMRIGIHCGLVIAGGVGAEGVKKDYTVMGDTVNLASRLESQAPPGGVLVSSDVVKRTRRRFEFGEVQLLKVKGKENAVEACELLREAEDPRLSEFLTPFVGRQSELGRLLEWWQLQAQPSSIEIFGPTGIGKTRLVNEAASRITGTQLLVVTATDNVCRRPFGLIRRLVRVVVERIGLQKELPRDENSFAEALKPLGQELDWFVSVLWFLVAPTRLGVIPPDPDAKTLRAMLERGICILLQQTRERLPGLTICFDSFEHADEESSLLLKTLMSDETAQFPRCILATRGDVRDGYNREEAQPVSEQIKLDQLRDTEASQLLNVLLEGAAIPESYRQDILKRAHGVPLYLEEIVHLLLEKRLLVPGGKHESLVFQEGNVALDAFLPGSIRAAMVARLDWLKPPEREFLGQCAVQGTEFNLNIVDHLRGPWGAIRSETERFVDSLVEKAILRCLSPEGDRFCFCQPLMQEACYETLMLRDRRILHGRTADVYCEILGGDEAVSPNTLAYHYEHAEHWGKAAKAYIRVGDRNAELFLNNEAVGEYERSLQMLAHIEAAGDIARFLECSARGKISEISLILGNYTIADINAQKMLENALGPQDQHRAYRLSGNVFFHRGLMQDARNALDKALQIAAQAAEISGEDRILLLLDYAELKYRENLPREAFEILEQAREYISEHSHQLLIRICMLQGKVVHTEGRFSEAVNLYAQAYEDAKQIGTLSDQARACNNLGTASRDLGDYEQAEKQFMQALDLWQKTGNMECIAGVSNNLGNIAMSQGDFTVAQNYQEKALQAYRQIGNIHGTALTQANLAILALEEGNGTRALTMTQSALATLGNSGHWLRGLVLVVFGEACLEDKQPQTANEVFDQVLQEYPQASHPLAVAGALRGKGRTLLDQGEAEPSLSFFTRAATLFEELKRAQEVARTWLYQAEAYLRLRQKKQAHDKLQQARSVFASMQAKKDLQKVIELEERLFSY